MSELRALVDVGLRCRRDGRPLVMATVVRVSGSSYRKPGARALFGEDGWLAGSVSAGCLERDLARSGAWRARAGAAVIGYDSTDRDPAGRLVGAGCGGVVDVLIERLEPGDPADPLAFIERCLSGDRRGAMATVLWSEAEGTPVGARLCAVDGEVVVSARLDGRLRTPMLEDALAAAAAGTAFERVYETGHGAVAALLEPILPAPRLFVFGVGPDAAPVAALGRSLGWHVLVCAPHARHDTSQRFAGADAVVVAPPDRMRPRIDGSDRAMAVVMNHEEQADTEVIAMLLESRALYIGVLGPRHRTERLLRRVGISRPDRRLHAPAGLDLGAQTPDEIALAIVAEMQAVLARARSTASFPRCAARSSALPIGSET